MRKELKLAILNWLYDNEKTWNRTVACYEAFRPYIYDTDGSYLIGGREVKEFVEAAAKLLYSDDDMIRKISELTY